MQEMTIRQKRAYRNIRYATNWIIGGYENTILDYSPGDPWHDGAKATLADHAKLVSEIYEASISDLYTEGSVQFGDAVEAYLRDIRFCGKDWLMEQVEAQVRKAGY